MSENYDVVVECCGIHDVCCWWVHGRMKMICLSYCYCFMMCLDGLSCCCLDFGDLSENYDNWCIWYFGCYEKSLIDVFEHWKMILSTFGE